MSEEDKSLQSLLQPKKQPKECISPLNGVKLKPLPKGKTANPAGYSKKRRELTEFKDYFEKHPEKWDKLIEVAEERARRGNYLFWNALTERLKGKVPQKNEITGEGGKPFSMTVRVVSKEAAEDTEKLRKMFGN